VKNKEALKFLLDNEEIINGMIKNVNWDDPDNDKSENEKLSQMFYEKFMRYPFESAPYGHKRSFDKFMHYTWKVWTCDCCFDEKAFIEMVYWWDIFKKQILDKQKGYDTIISTPP